MGRWEPVSARPNGGMREARYELRGIGHKQRRRHGVKTRTERDANEMKGNEMKGNEETGGGRNTEGMQEKRGDRPPYPRLRRRRRCQCKQTTSHLRQTRTRLSADLTLSLRTGRLTGHERRLRTHARTPGAGCWVWRWYRVSRPTACGAHGAGDEWDGHDEENVQENAPAAPSGAERGMVPASIASTLRRRRDAWRWCRVERLRLQPGRRRQRVYLPRRQDIHSPWWCSGRQSISLANTLLDWIGMWVSVRTDERGRRERRADGVCMACAMGE